MNHALFEKHYQEQLKLLPEISQQALTSFNWVNVLLDIGKSFALQLDELEDLQVETMMLLVGITPPDEYEQELIKVLPLSKIEIEKLLDSINEKILIPIHDYIINGGPTKTPDPLTSSGVTLGTDENNSSPVESSPLIIEPTKLPDDTDLLSTLDPQKREDIIEHKLDDIFHEIPEHIEHL